MVSHADADSHANADSQYENVWMHLLKEKTVRIRASLWSSVVKRHYLLLMKEKYAGIFNNVLFQIDALKLCYCCCGFV